MYPSPLRDGGYDVADFLAIHPDYGVVEDFQPLRRPGPPARHARDRRLRHEPHLERSSVVPGVALEPGLAQARLVRVVGHRQALRGRAHHLHGHRGVQLDVGSGRRRVLLAPLLPSPARPQLRQSRGGGGDARRRCASGSTSASTASGSTPCRTSTSATGRTARTCPRRTPSCAACAAYVDYSHPDTVLLAEANQWPADVVEYFGDGDECHMAFHFPVMPRMFMALRREEARPIYEILAQTPAIPGQLPVGPVPAQPRRADARDGGRRGARLHVRGVRQGSAHAHQRRHPPAPRAAARQRARRDRARARDPLLAARQPRPLLRRRDRHGRQRLPRRSRRRAHADALDGRPQRRLLARRLRAALPAAADGSRDGLPGGQRRGAAAHAHLAAALAAPLHRAAQGAPGVRSRHLRAARARQSAHLRPRAPLRGRRRAVRPQPRAQRAGRDARPLGVRRAACPRSSSAAPQFPDGDERSLPAHARPARLLLARNCGGPMLDLTRLPEAELGAFMARQPWFRAHGREDARRARARGDLRAHGRAAARDRARRGRDRARPQRDLPAADRAAPGGRAAPWRRSRRSTAGRPTTRSPTPSSSTS